MYICNAPPTISFMWLQLDHMFWGLVWFIYFVLSHILSFWVRLSCHDFPKDLDTQPSMQSTCSGSTDKLNKLYLIAAGPSSATILPNFHKLDPQSSAQLKNPHSVFFFFSLLRREATANKP